MFFEGLGTAFAGFFALVALLLAAFAGISAGTAG